VTTTASEVDVVLTQNSFTQDNQQITYDPNATVELLSSPQTVYNTPDSPYSLTNGSGDISSTVNGFSDGNGGSVGPYDYSYTISYSGDGQIIAIPLINSGDVYNVSLTGGATLGGLNELPNGETVAQLFGTAYTDAIVINLPDADSGTNTLSFSFDSAFLPTDAQWDIIESGDFTSFDPPIPGSTPEPGTVWFVPVVAAALFGIRRRGASLVA
jgi:hypothetical protein